MPVPSGKVLASARTEAADGALLDGRITGATR